ncbi:hypothetical protein AU252_22570 [Pseudarthrobacter sulfonivorans]|uniref:Uncharacterized protein n=1 Tax=Pseudarthrobacter sulfonivorans TaxID=121292 RepID=A0A0U3QQ05_9MICC|nr:DUF2474 domain-containing protein [Pseudarthrobacter sulfonivorans]ALV43611.1 hypothetical protein AU252_22570 [Pseudarthrobacter sulfonivorans]
MDGPLGSVDGVEAGELERLRRRAYGRDGDIAGDVAAQARLSELEAAQHRQLTPVIDPAPSVPTAPWWRRHRWLMILGGAIAALALVAWLSQLLADEPTAIPANTLTEMALPVPDAQHRWKAVPAPDFVLALESVGADADKPQDNLGTLDALGLNANELRQYENFGRHRVWSGESRYGTVCLLVADYAIRERNGAEGCSPKGLETVAEMMWSHDQGLHRFVLNGDHVEVYVFHRAADPSDASKGSVPFK